MSDLKPRGEKPPYWLLPMKTLVGVVEVLKYGAKKYAPWNWRTADSGQATQAEYLSAAYRHLSELEGPENVLAKDDESGLYHIDHAITSLIILRYHAVRSSAIPLAVLPSATWTFPERKAPDL